MADKPPITKKEPKRNIWVAVALASGVIVFFVVIVGLVIYRTNSKTTDASKTATTTAKKNTTTSDTNINQKSTPSIKQSAEDAEKYKGWQTYENQSWRIFSRYPPGWTKTEAKGSLNVTFLGPPTAAGGVILNECAFSIFVEEVPAGMTLEAYVQAARSAPLGGGAAAEETETSIGESPAIKVVDTYVDVGAPWKRQRIWTIKNGRAYTFSYTASTNYGGTNFYTLHSGTADMILASVIISD